MNNSQHIQALAPVTPGQVLVYMQAIGAAVNGIAATFSSLPEINAIASLVATAIQTSTFVNLICFLWNTFLGKTPSTEEVQHAVTKYFAGQLATV